MSTDADITRDGNDSSCLTVPSLYTTVTKGLRLSYDWPNVGRDDTNFNVTIVGENLSCDSTETGEMFVYFTDVAAKFNKRDPFLGKREMCTLVGTPSSTYCNYLCKISMIGRKVFVYVTDSRSDSDTSANPRKICKVLYP